MENAIIQQWRLYKLMGFYTIFSNNKEKLKSSNIIRKTYTTILRIMFALDPIIPYNATIKLYYYISFGVIPDFENPRDFNEKIQWLKAFYRNPLIIKCADKYSVREYVGESGYENILTPLYAVYNSSDDINFAELPNRFAMKAVHGCGTNLICFDKKDINETNVRKQFSKWMKKRIGNISGEKHYNFIKPRIIVEENLASENNKLPLDYKIYCFNGEPRCICVYADRGEAVLGTTRAFFDFDWNNLDYCKKEYKTDPKRFEKPSTLTKMYEVAKKLSSPFPFVRVDLYAVSDRVIFGELTFTPTGGRGKAYNEECSKQFSDWLELPPKSKDLNWKHYNTRC